VLCQCGHNQDRWADIAPAARVMLVLSESSALGRSVPLVVGWAHAGGHSSTSWLAGNPGSSIHASLHFSCE
jgi:hypothetical protein